MADRIVVQVQFKKFIWMCPYCDTEETVDANMGGGNTYEHTCSNCSKVFNQSGPNMVEYNGTLKYTPEEYDVKKEADIISEKSTKCAAWLQEYKNPPAYIEPSIEDLQQEKDRLDKEAELLQEQIDAKTAKEIS